jgi:hypothetical protein
VRASEITLNLDNPAAEFPAASKFGLVTILRLQSSDFSQIETQAVRAISEAMRTNPHITLQIVIEPLGPPERLHANLLQSILETCYSSTSYLDRYYSLQPGHLLGAKRLFVLLPVEERPLLSQSWIQEIGRYATILWHGRQPPSTPLAEFERLLDQEE